MTEFEELREDVLRFYSAMLALGSDELAGTRLRLLEESRDRLATGQYLIVVCGESRRGKSSLLNGLVERPGLFPVDIDITTSAVVTLRWGAQDSAEVHFVENGPWDSNSARVPETIPLSRTAEFVTEQGNPGNGKNVLHVDMSAPIAQLESGLVLVDTPGLGSVNPGHVAATRSLLAVADAVVFVASAVEPLSMPELNFLEVALRECPVVVTALTMIDNVVSAAPIVEEARTRIANMVGSDPAGLVIVPVSSFRKRIALEEENPELMAASGFPKLEAEIWDGLARTRGAARIYAALDALDVALAEAAAPLANDLAALRGDGAKMAAELRAEQERYRQMNADSRGWHRDLLNDIYQASHPIQQGLDNDLGRILDQFRQALGTDGAFDDPPALIRQVSEAIVDTANQATRAIEAEMERLAGEYAAVTELPITVSGIPDTSFDPAIVATTLESRSKPQGYARLGTLMGAATGVAVGTIVPTFGSIAGAMVGNLAGMFGGRRLQQRNAEEQHRRAYAAELRDNALPRLEAARRQLNRDVADQVQDYGRALARAIEDEARARADSLAKSVRLLNETDHRDNRERADRKDDLIARRQSYSDLRAELDALRVAHGRLAARDPREPADTTRSGEAASALGTGPFSPGRATYDELELPTSPERSQPTTGDPERRFLKARYPESIPVGEPFSLLASIVVTGPASAALKPFGLPAEGRDVLLVIHAPGLRLLGRQRLTVHVPGRGDSEPVMFELRADTPGPHSASVTAWLGGSYLGELLVEIAAERGGPPSPHRDVLTEIATGDTDGAVSLVVRYDPVQNSYRFEFRDEDNPDWVTSHLAYDPGPQVERLVAGLDELAKGRSGFSSAQARDYLINAGAGLWRELLPARLREQFWDRQHRIRQMTILTDKDVVPWELLYPMDPGHDCGFLVEQFPVTRSVFGRRLPRRLNLSPARFVLPEGSPPMAADEIEAVRRLLAPRQPAEAAIGALTPLLDLIRSGDFGLLHFACHNRFDPADGSSITLGNAPFSPELLTTAAIGQVLARSEPTVFINACRTAGSVPTYNRLDGWASKFLEAGAAAFIGSMWAVSDGAAREFAQELYGQLQAGSSLGEAVVRARQVAGSQSDDPTWLAYTVYGDPRATVRQQP